MVVSDFTKAAIATMVLDIGLFHIIWTTPTTMHWFDSIFVGVVFCSHILFYFALFFNDEDLIQYLHYLIFMSLSVSIFLENTKLSIVCLGLLLTIQILWIIENRCILNKKETEFGYSKELSLAVLLYTVILSIKIGGRSPLRPSKK